MAGLARSSNGQGRYADSELDGPAAALWFCSAAATYRETYLRFCKGNVRTTSRLIVLFRKTVGAADSVDARRPGGTNMGVAASPFAPPGVAVGVAVGGWCMI